MLGIPAFLWRYLAHTIMSSADILASIDEDALGWVRGALEDAAEDVHEFDEFAEVAGPIVEAGCADCDDLDTAAVVRALWAERAGSAAELAAADDEAGSPPGAADDEPGAPAKLDTAVSMATSAGGNMHAQFASAAMLNRSSNPFLQQNSTFKLSERDLQKAMKTAEKRAKKLAKAMARGSEAAAAAMEENQSLAAAAAKAAADSAAAAKADSWSNGTINLPGIHVSVGAGGDSKSLLRDTTLRIVKGRRYGLVAPVRDFALWPSRAAPCCTPCARTHTRICTQRWPHSHTLPPCPPRCFRMALARPCCFGTLQAGHSLAGHHLRRCCTCLPRCRPLTRLC